MVASLAEWAEHYLKARDAFERKMVSLDKSKDGLSVKYKNRQLAVVCQTSLDVAAVPTTGHVLLVVAQTKQNLDGLVKAFPMLAKNPELTVAFANPKTTEKWLVKPHVHNGVADPESLKTGLLTMYETVSE